MSTRGSWVFREGRMVPKHEAAKRDYAIIASKRSNLPSPAVISDNMPAFKSHVDGKTWFDSKSAWQKHVKAAGYEIVGSDMPKPSRRFDERKYAEEVKRDIAEAFQMHEQGYVAPPVERAEEFKTAEVAAVARENSGLAYLHEDPVSIVNREPPTPKPAGKPKRGGGRKSKRGK